MRGRRTKDCATAHELDRQLYRQMWHLARKHPATPRGEAARQWLENRRAAHKLAHPPRPPYQKRLRACCASRKRNRQLTPEEKARLHELKRIRYSVDDDFRAKVNAYNRDFYQRNREKILAQHKIYNARPDVLARSRARANSPEAKAARRARYVRKASRCAARHASWTSAMLTKAELKQLPHDERRRVRQRQNYRRTILCAASTP